MKKKRIMAFAAALLAICLFGEWSQEEAQAELSTAIAKWGVDADAFRGAVDSAFGSAYNSLEKRQFLCNWYCSILDLQISPAASIADTNTWLRAKTYAVLELGDSSEIKNSTNCWFAAAREYAWLNRMDRQEWYQLSGVEHIVKETFTDGVVVVDSPFRMGDTSAECRAYEQRNRDARELKRSLSLAKHAICKGIQSAVASPVFASLNTPAQNSIVSNLVEVACLTQEEAAALGLTNVVEVLAK